MPWWGLVAGLLAILCALALPLAPVAMSTPEVSWPAVPGQPSSTMLGLTSQEPLTLDVRFSCATARVAGSTDAGVLLSTIRPETPSAQTEGLSVTVGGGVLRIVSAGHVLLREPVPAGPCRYVLTGDGAGLRISRDGVELGRASARALPGIDVLATSLPALSAADGEELAVRIGVDDQFATSPTALKLGLTGVCLLSAALALLWLRGAGTPAPARRPARDRRRGPPFWLRRGVDVVWVGVALLWTPIAPMTGDDGYYAAMARNAPIEGYVGNYYQLLNQSFTPFTWFYRLLGWWEQLVGDAPVLLRVPALVAGLATYAMAARLVASVPYRGQWPRTAAHAVLALAFGAWWLPYDMGVRPEAMVALAATATLLAVAVALRRGSLLWWGIAVLLAAVGFVCHPTGFVVLGPLIAGLPRLIRLVRTGRAVATLARIVCVVAPGAVASAVAFGDGTLRDFLRGQEIFLAAQPQQGWTDEYLRYGMLLGPDFMGAYAKRLPVLLTILALAGWLVLAAALRGRGRPLPEVLHLSAVSTGLGLLALWLTPSKWTFHFGSLAGVGAVFLTLLLCALPRLAARVRRQGAGLPAPTVLAAVAAGVVVVALSFTGPNSWPSSWMLGVPQADVPPSLGVRLGSPLAWAVLAALATAAGWWWARRRRAGRTWRVAALSALPLVLVAALVVGDGYLLGTFGYAAIRPQDTWSPWGDRLRDPLSQDCHAAGAFQVLDDRDAAPLRAVPGAAAPSASQPPAFAGGSGWYVAVPPPSTAGRVWGSLRPPALNAATGTFTTRWLQLPQVDPGQRRVALTVAGNLATGNHLVAEYGRTGPGGVEAVGRQVLDDDLDSPYWRTLVLSTRIPARTGADTVRLVATDGTTDVGGWLAFSEPSVRSMVSVQQYLGGSEPVAVAWQIALLFPCQEQPRVASGITEPADYGILYGASVPAALGDASMLVVRGGLFVPLLREASVTSIPAVLPGAPQVTDVGIYRFEVPYPTDGYRLTTGSTTVSGWAAPPGWGHRPAR